MYRGVGSPVVPDLLQSLHMALEKILLEFAQIVESDIIEDILLEILIKSKSASLTAVICSIVLANPDKFYSIALILFRTIELFHLDSIRSINEFQVLTPFTPNNEFYEKERAKAKEDKHRNSHIESLFLNYQFCGVKGFSEEQNTEFIEKLYEIIDKHKIAIQSKSKNEQKTLGILLTRMDRRTMKPTVKEYDNSYYIIELNPQLSPELREYSEQSTKQHEDVFKYISLKLWADFIHRKTYPTPNENYKQYDDNPLEALKEAKQLIEDLNNKQISLLPMDEFIPSFVCSKLMIEHKEKLSIEDKKFCKEIILDFVSKLFSDDYHNQVSDGVEAALHAIPSLMTEYPDENENFILILVLSLFDDIKVGNKRICDYVIESIHESKMWELYSKEAQTILLSYIKLKPIYNNIYNQKRKEQGFWRRIPKSSILQEFDKRITDFSFINISFDIHYLDSFDIHDLEIIYQLIPSNTKDEIHLKIYEKSLPLIASKLLIDRRSYKDAFGEDSNIYLLRLHIFKRFAYFILEREIQEIDTYIQPFIDNFSGTEEMSSFLDKIISAEDYKDRYEQFWYVWNKLYPQFIETCNHSHSYHIKNVITSYLLAWQWWREGIEEWHSLKKENLLLYANVARDLGNIPAVLYSIAKVLNSIGSKFTKEGIDWIYSIVSNHKLLKMGDFESNTLYYLEKFMRKYVFMNKEQIKQEIRLKNKVIPILEFMIERGSVRGYLLRESIL
jgi:hypothetical protein